ncbi:MAG: YebC/PmpR family DNA-binding transcriptional regulator [Anaerolineaceae bacterium 4572_5.1]|nr:MAG: YebC/PmpR family DNA-binding transcriptional regulator [Anaerolineaceae bacterium 4572_5.1]
MSGHSKWSNIKHKKAREDARRGKIFTKLAREIEIAAREGGGDPETNFGLRLAIDNAKSANMPNDNVERAIKRGTGEDKDGVKMEQIFYEGYAPHGVALMVKCITDNRNRTVSDIRHILSKAGGSMGEGGSVAWQFTNISFFTIPAKGNDYDAIFELALDAGAEDVLEDEDFIEIIGPVEIFKTTHDRLRAEGIEIISSGLRLQPNQELSLDVEKTLQVMGVIERLEDLFDVQEVSSNLEISDEALEKLAEED